MDHYFNFKSRSVEMLKNDYLCDTTLEAEGVEFRVHGIIICAHSTYFQQKINSLIKQGRLSMNRQSQLHIVLPGLTSIGLRSIIDYIYSGSIVLKSETLEKVLETARHLDLHLIVCDCIEFMNDSVNTKNALYYLKLIDIYQLDKVTDVLNCVLKNFSILMKGKDFLSLSERIVLDILSSDDLCIESEVDLFSSLVKWMTVKRKVNSKTKLLHLVRYGLINSNDMATVYKNPIFYGDNMENRNLLHSILDLKYKQDAKDMIDINLYRRRSSKTSLLVIMDHSQCTYINFYTLCQEGLQEIEHRSDSFVHSKDDLKGVVLNNFVYMLKSQESQLYMSTYDLKNKEFKVETCFSAVRTNYAFVAFKNQLLILGGRDEYDKLLTSVLCFDIRTKQLVNHKALPIELYHHAAVSVSNDFFICGGITSDDIALRILYKLPLGHESWVQLSPMNFARWDHSVSADYRGAPCLYVFGGDGEKSMCLDIPECYSIETDQWTMLQPMPYPSCLNSSVAHHDQIYVFGGYSCVNRNFTDKVQVFSLVSKNWTVLENRLHVPAPVVCASLIYTNV